MRANPAPERQLLNRLRLIFRAAVVLNWIAMLAIWFLHGISKPIAAAAFAAFKLTAVCAALWLLAEIVEAAAKRTHVLNPVVDAILTLPMFGFWFLIVASSF